MSSDDLMPYQKKIKEWIKDIPPNIREQIANGTLPTGPIIMNMRGKSKTTAHMIEEGYITRQREFFDVHGYFDESSDTDKEETILKYAQQWAWEQTERLKEGTPAHTNQMQVFNHIKEKLRQLRHDRVVAHKMNHKQTGDA